MMPNLDQAGDDAAEKGAEIWDSAEGFGSDDQSSTASVPQIEPAGEDLDASFEGGTSEDLSSDGQSSDGSPGTPFIECRFCAELYRDGRTCVETEQLYDLFHGDCATCVEVDWKLCDGCKHTRLMHHVLCTEEMFTTTMNPLQHIKDSVVGGEALSCAFCYFMAEIMLGLEGHFLEALWNMDKFPDLNIAHYLGEPPSATSGLYSGLYASISSFRMEWFPVGSEGWAASNRIGVGFKSPASSANNPSSASRCHGTAMEYSQPYKSRLPGNAQHMALSRARRLGDVVNWEVMKGLFTACCKDHRSCDSSGFQPPPDFRVIDLESRCLVKPQGPTEFCALSYVWGKQGGPETEKTDLLSKKTLEGLEQRGSLSSSLLPKTIEDAVQVCLALGMRYLWVDRFCIVQDDDQSKHHQIHAMGDIFAFAKLVIIAADAEDMHTGISGVSCPRQNEQWTLSSRSLDLVEALPAMSNTLLESKVCTRAWTYQEAVLPRRKVWLTRVQAYFQCCEGVFSEDIFRSTNDDGSYKLDRTEAKPLIESFFDHLWAYTFRSLTFQSDVYNAITGIANTLYGADILVYGLPRPDFDQALLWLPVSSKPVKARVANDTVLPSWSWGCVDDGEIVQRFEGGLNRSFCGTLVQWTVCIESGGQLSLIRLNESNAPISWTKKGHLVMFGSENFPRRSALAISPSLYMALAWTEKCIWPPGPAGLDSPGRLTFDEMREKADALWPSYDAFSRALDSKNYQSGRDTAALSMNVVPGSLLGQAQTAMLEMTRFTGPKGEHVFEYLGFEIRHRGRHIGMARISASPPPHGSLTRVVALSVFNNANQSENYESHLRYLAAGYPSIQRNANADSDEEDLSRVEAAGWQEVLQARDEHLTFFDCNGDALLPPPMLNVMLVEADGPCFRRIGLGWVYLARWVHVDRQFETVVLK